MGFLVVKGTDLDYLKQKKKKNSFIRDWAADRLDEKAKVPSLENGSEPKEIMKGDLLPSLPRDSLVQFQCHQREHWTLLYMFIKSQCDFSQTPAH